MLGALVYGIFLVAGVVLVSWLIDRKKMRGVPHTMTGVIIDSFIVAVIITLFHSGSLWWFAGVFLGQVLAYSILLRTSFMKSRTVRANEA